MSIIRADSIKNRAGDGAPDFPNGITVTGIVTATTLNNVADNVDVDDFISVGNNIHLGNAGVVTATSFSGSGASLTSLPAANLTGTLPAISGANLTGIPSLVRSVHHKADGVRGSHNNQIQNNSFTSAHNLTRLQISVTPKDVNSIFHIQGSLSLTHYGSYEGVVWITFQIAGGNEQMVAGNSDTSLRCTYRPNLASDTGSTMQVPTPVDIMVDPNTTSVVTFRVRVATRSNGYPMFINRDANNTTNTSDGGGTLSTITVTELDGSNSDDMTITDDTIYRGT